MKHAWLTVDLEEWYHLDYLKGYPCRESGVRVVPLIFDFLDMLDEEGVKVDQILGHGGLFKTKGVGQNIMAAAMNTPVAVMETAGEGGAWGIALLAGYMVDKQEGETLEDYLANRIFAGKLGETVQPDPKDVASFNDYIRRYSAGLPIERAAVESIKL